MINMYEQRFSNNPLGSSNLNFQGEDNDRLLTNQISKPKLCLLTNHCVFSFYLFLEGPVDLGVIILRRSLRRESLQRQTKPFSLL